MLPAKIAYGLCFMFTLFTIVPLVSGRIKFSRDNYLTRRDRPQAYWAMVGSSFLLAILFLVIALVQPGRPV